MYLLSSEDKGLQGKRGVWRHSKLMDENSSISFATSHNVSLEIFKRK